MFREFQGVNFKLDAYNKVCEVVPDRNVFLNIQSIEHFYWFDEEKKIVAVRTKTGVDFRFLWNKPLGDVISS